MNLTFRHGTRTCQECEQTAEGGYVIVLRGDVHSLCEECAKTLTRTLSRGIVRVENKRQKVRHSYC
jgi:hypothetical protein